MLTYSLRELTAAVRNLEQPNRGGMTSPSLCTSTESRGAENKTLSVVVAECDPLKTVYREEGHGPDPERHGCARSGVQEHANQGADTR